MQSADSNGISVQVHENAALGLWINRKNVMTLGNICICGHLFITAGPFPTPHFLCSTYDTASLICTDLCNADAVFKS